MPSTGKFQLTTIHDSFTTAVFCDEAIHVYGISGGPHNRAREAWLNQDLVEQGQRWLSNTDTTNQCFAIVQPAGAGGPQQLRLFLLSGGLLQCVTPADGKTRRVNIAIDSSISETTYRIVARAAGPLVIATTASGGHPNEVLVYGCSWHDLDRGAQLTESHIPIPAAYATPGGAIGFNIDQHAALLASPDGEQLLLSLQGNKKLVIAEIPLANLLGGATWSQLPGALTILDLHAAPDGHAYAVCQHDDGLHLWINDAPGRWFDMGDPTEGAIPSAESCRTVFIPSPAKADEVDRVLLLRTDKTSDQITYWRSRLGSEPLALDRAMDAGIAIVGANDAYNFGTGDFTVELWAQTIHTSTSLPSAPLLKMQAHEGDAASGGANGWGFNYGDDGSVSFSILTTGGEQHVVSDPITPDGDWHHYAALRRQGVLELYVDGVPVAKSADKQDLDIEIDPSGSLYFGYDPHVGGKNSLNAPLWFTGRLDEIRLWRVARKSYEIDQARFHHMAPDAPSLVGQWGFDGGLMRDSSSVANHGVLDVGARFAQAGVEFVPEGQPYVRVQSTLMEDWQPSADGKTLVQARNYRTTISLCLSDGSPRISSDNTRKDVFVSASAPCEIRLAGITYQVGPGKEAAFSSDWSAKLNVVTDAGSDLSHPVLFLRTDFMAAGENIVIAPDREVLHKLAGITAEQVATISDQLTPDDAAALAQTIRTAARPALHYAVAAPPNALRAATNGAQKRFYLSPDPCPCCDAHSCDVLCDYRPAAGNLTRLATPAFMEHAHWQLDFKARRFSPVTQDVANTHLALVAAADGTGAGDLFAKFVSGEIKAVLAVVSTVRTGARDVINAVIHYVDQSGVVRQLQHALQTVEDIVAFVAGAIRQIVGAAVDGISKVIDIVTTLFAWDDIRKTRDDLLQGFTLLCNAYTRRVEDGTLADSLRKSMDDVWAQLNWTPPDDAGESMNDARGRTHSHPISDLIRKIQDSPQAQWLTQKLNEIHFSAPVGIALPAFGSADAALRLGDDVAGTIADEVALFQDKVIGYFEQDGGIFATTGVQVRADFQTLATRLYESISGPILGDCVELSGDLVKWLRDDFGQIEVDLPLLSLLMDPQGEHPVKVSPLTLLATVIAIPLTVGCKMALGVAPDLSKLYTPRLARSGDAVAADGPFDLTYREAMIVDAVCTATFTGFNTYVDVRTLNRRLTHVWPAVLPGEQLLGATAFGAIYVLPLAMVGMEHIRYQESDQQYEKDWMETAARATAYAGLVPWAWSVFKMPHVAMKCGFPLPKRTEPEPDLLGVSVGAGLSVVSLIFYTIVGVRRILQHDPKGPLYGFTGMVGMIAPFAKLMLIDRMQKGGMTEGPTVPQEIVGFGEPIGAGLTMATDFLRNW